MGERKLYDLLTALKDCGTDRFLCVRGLFASVSVGTGDDGAVKGAVDAEAVLCALKKLNVMHCLSVTDIEACIYKLDPHCENGCIETSEIEKAVNKMIEIRLKDTQDVAE